MTHKIPSLANWFVTEQCRAKAKIKYDLNHLESNLTKNMKFFSKSEKCPTEVVDSCCVLAKRYLDYLNLVGEKNKTYKLDLAPRDSESNWYSLLQNSISLKAQLTSKLSYDEELELTVHIASIYHQIATCKNGITNLNETGPSSSLLDDLNALFKKEYIKDWLSALVKFWNENNTQCSSLSVIFRDWDLIQQQLALEYFSRADLISLVNALFFYKLYPDKLFNELIHPEKLVSIRMRLGVIHHFIETVQKHLYHSAQQHELIAGVDYLFHGDELPQGIMIEVDEGFVEIIQSAVKKLKVVFTSENEKQVTLERLHDLGRAYKFWFNPNRLIDAVMVLEQRLVKTKTTDEYNLLVFHQEMVVLYSQLTTTECLDLYGYFANNDTRYLLYTLFSILEGQEIDWLPNISEIELSAIASVFQALKCVMEALRVALKARHVNTQSYLYDLAKKSIQARKRNREAVLRIIAIYGCETITVSESVQKLFNYIEEGN